MHSETPVEASLHVRIINDFGQWGIATVEDGGGVCIRTGEVPPQDSPKATRAEAVVAAFAAILEACAGRPCVELDVAPGRLRLAISEMIGQFPGIALAEGSWVAPEHRAALVEAMKEMPDHFVGKEKREAVSMVVSTDASMHSRGHIAGLGHVIAAKDGTVLSVGSKAQPVARKGDIRSGELLAILAGLKGMVGRHPVPLPGEGAVTVQSDSQAALAFLEAVRAGRTPAGAPEEHVATAQEILGFGSRMELRFRWIKGHAGHPGNEAADRLAVLARRGEEFKVPADTRSRMFRALRDDLVGTAAA